ncbi:hypothetical protein ACFQE8_24870 [Salinirubellus sp. GCM10025818]|uniref:hypothetical protein n=1 Tax=Salinirubellus TaxID=2162630 RepID=UPI0030D47E8F
MTLLDTLVKQPLVRTFGEPRLRRLLLATPLSEWYWRVAPCLHRQGRHLSPGYVDPPIDPFQLFLVDPDRITRFTGRPFPPWVTRWQDFGAVIDGNWDQRRAPPIHPDYEGVDPSLYLAERFSETRLHRGLIDHFVEGVPWQDLDFVNELVDHVRSTNTAVWQDCSTVAEIRGYCRKLDRLYQDMRERGCLSIRELNRRENRLLTFRGVMEKEILVDLTRTGEPVFVTGRHRLSLAKILGLNRIPVAVVARHPEWIARRGKGHPAGPRSGSEGPFGQESTVGDPLNVSW